jgi:hypothetical protein
MRTLREMMDLVEAAQREGVAEGIFGIDSNIKGRIQNIVSDLSNIPGYWDHRAQTFTPGGLDKLKTSLENNPKYIRYALNLTADDYNADMSEEQVEESTPEAMSKIDKLFPK